MTKSVLDVGNCDMDHSSIQDLLNSHFDVEIDRVHGPTDALAAMKNKTYHLVLINRLMDRDHSPGIEIINSMKADGELSDVPVMLITNFPDHQETAMAAGALEGFGKAALREPETVERLRGVLA